MLAGGAGAAESVSQPSLLRYRLVMVAGSMRQSAKGPNQTGRLLCTMFGNSPELASFDHMQDLAEKNYRYTRLLKIGQEVLLCSYRFKATYTYGL